MPNMNTLSQNIKEEFVLRAISQIDSKYIFVFDLRFQGHIDDQISDLCCSLRSLANYCAKYEHPRACTILCKCSFY